MFSSHPPPPSDFAISQVPSRVTSSSFQPFIVKTGCWTRLFGLTLLSFLNHFWSPFGLTCLAAKFNSLFFDQNAHASDSGGLQLSTSDSSSVPSSSLGGVFGSAARNDRKSALKAAFQVRRRKSHLMFWIKRKCSNCSAVVPILW